MSAKRRLRIGYSRKIFSRPEFQSIVEAHFGIWESRRIMRAYRQAKYAHRGQTRKDFSRYFDHPKSIALIIMLELKIYFSKLVILGLLHDVMEDSHLHTWDDISDMFGISVAQGLDQITKRDGKNYFEILAHAKWWVIVGKLADRLHNMRQMKNTNAAFRRRQLEETKREFPMLIEALKKKIPKEFKSVVPYIERELLYAMKKVERSL